MNLTSTLYIKKRWMQKRPAKRQQWSDGGQLSNWRQVSNWSSCCAGGRSTRASYLLHVQPPLPCFTVPPLATVLDQLEIQQRIDSSSWHENLPISCLKHASSPRSSKQCLSLIRFADWFLFLSTKVFFSFYRSITHCWRRIVMYATKRWSGFCLITKRMNERDGTVLLGHMERRLVFGSGSPRALALSNDSNAHLVTPNTMQ